MKVRVKYKAGDHSLDETFTGSTPEEVVSGMQRQAASRLGFALRLLVNSLSPLGFAQELVKRYNQETGKSTASPKSCAEFLKLGEEEGIVTVLEP